MITNIIDFSIKNKLVVGMLTLGIIIGGIYSMTHVPIDAVPDITNNQVQIITTAPNLSTEDIEQFVTYPVELSMANLPGVVEIRSISRFGISVVTVVFEDDMGTYLPRQLVAEKLSLVKQDIPQGFGEPYIGPISTGLGEIYQYALELEPAYDSLYNLTELRSIQDWIVRRQMAMVPGVVEVNSFGGHVKQYEVAIDPDRLRSMELSIAEVYKALNENNQNTGGAYIEKDHRANFIRGEGLARSKEAIENIVVKTVNNRPILIKDIAEVQFGHAMRYGAFTRNGKGEAVGGMIMMLKDENSNKVINAVKKRMEAIEKSLPEGVHIKPFLDRSKLVASTTSTVKTNLMEGGLIVILVLVFLLGNFRGGLIVASTIPLSLLFAFILMHAFGVWANLMSLGAIDFGIIVDGAVIIVESVVFTLSNSMYRKKKLTRQEKDTIASKASGKMMNAAFFGQLIVLIVFVPILALEGVEGKMFKPMALTFGFAIIGAMVLCLTYVPMMSAWLLKPPSQNKKPAFGDIIILILENTFEPILTWSLKKSAVVVSIALILFGSAVFIFTRLGGEFAPKLDEGDIAFHAMLKPGSSLSETVEMCTIIEKRILDKFPEAEQIVGKIGVSDVPTDPMPMDIADMILILKPQDEWVSASSKKELIEKIKYELSDLPGVNYEFTQPIEMRFNELLTGVREDLAIKVFGEDMNILAEKAEKIGQLINGIEGVADMRVEATLGLPQMTVHYNREKLAQYGLSVEKLNNYVSTAFAGGKAGVIFEGERRFDLVIRLNKEHRKNIEDLKYLFVDLTGGAQIPLKEVADISYEPGPMQISRDNTNRRIYVGVNVRGRDVESLVKEIEAKLDAELDLPPGYFIRYGGAFENLQRAKERLTILVPAALLLIFILVYFALRSLPQTIMIYVAIPLSAIGGVLALWARGMPFSISAGVGFIVLFGVAVLNGLVLISSFNELKEEGNMNLKDIILKGTRRRIRPILLTASTDILGFLPMALSGSAGAEVQRPLATVVIGGLLTATLLTLIILPVLYQWVSKRSFGKAPASLVVVLLGMCMTVPAVAQENVLTLDEALSKAKANYPSIQLAQQNIEQQEVLKKQNIDLGNTQLFTSNEEAGNGNTGVRTLIGVQQSNIDLFSIPAKNNYYQSAIDLAEENAKLTELELKKQVYITYYAASRAKEKYLLMQQLDSIYNAFLKAAELRYKTEAITKLEWLSAKSRYEQLKIKLLEAEKTYTRSLAALNQYIQVDSFTVTVLTGFYEPTFYPDTAIGSNNPFLSYYRQDITTKDQQTRLEKAALLPKINAQYGFQDVNGVGGFYTYQAGVSFPLWFRPQQSRIQAAKLEADKARSNYAIKKRNIESNLAQLQQQYEQHKQVVVYYQEHLLPLVDEQLKATVLSYKEGAINYTTHIQNLDNNITTQQAYYDHLYNLLETQILINYLNGKL